MSPGLSHEVLLLPATSTLPPNLAPDSLSYVPKEDLIRTDSFQSTA